METAKPIKLNVSGPRAAGLEAKWGKRNGQPILLVRQLKSDLRHQRKWWTVSKRMLSFATESGWAEAFDQCTVLADIF